MFPIRTRHVTAQRVMTIQRRLRAAETDDFVAEARAAFRGHLDGRAPTGPFTLIFHGIVDDESDGPLEAILGCPDDVNPSDLIGIRTEPAHDEAFTTITKAQWEYPTILAAYDAIASSPQATARPGGRLSCREVYVADPTPFATTNSSATSPTPSDRPSPHERSEVCQGRRLTGEIGAAGASNINAEHRQPRQCRRAPNETLLVVEGAVCVSAGARRSVTGQPSRRQRSRPGIPRSRWSRTAGGSGPTESSFGRRPRIWARSV